MKVKVSLDALDDRVPELVVAELKRPDSEYRVTNHELIGSSYFPAYDILVEGDGRIKRVFTTEISISEGVELGLERHEDYGLVMPETERMIMIGHVANSTFSEVRMIIRVDDK